MTTKVLKVLFCSLLSCNKGTGSCYKTSCTCDNVAPFSSFTARISLLNTMGGIYLFTLCNKDTVCLQGVRVLQDISTGWTVVKLQPWDFPCLQGLFCHHSLTMLSFSVVIIHNRVSLADYRNDSVTNLDNSVNANRWVQKTVTSLFVF